MSEPTTQSSVRLPVNAERLSDAVVSEALAVAAKAALATGDSAEVRRVVECFLVGVDVLRARISPVSE